MVSGKNPSGIPSAYVVSKDEAEIGVPNTERHTDRFGLKSNKKWLKLLVYLIIIKI